MWEWTEITYRHTLFYCISLYCASKTPFIFTNWKVCGNPASSKSTGIFPTCCVHAWPLKKKKIIHWKQIMAVMRKLNWQRARRISQAVIVLHDAFQNLQNNICTTVLHISCNTRQTYWHPCFQEDVWNTSPWNKKKLTKFLNHLLLKISQL